MDDTPVEKASEGTGGETNENSTTEEKKWEPEKEKEQESNDDSGKQQEGGKGREKRKNKQKEKKSQTSEGSTEIHDESKDAYAKEKSDEVQDSMGDSDHESSRDEAKDGDGDKKADDQELDSTSTENKHNGGENAHGEGEGGDAMEEKEERDLSGNSDHEWSGDKPKEGDKDKKIDDQETDISNTENRHDGGEETDTKDASLVTVGDEETQAATKEVEMQLEALKRDSVIDTSVDQAHERDPSEDEYDIIQELTDLPTKFQQTAGKVAEHLRPDVIKWKDTSKVYFDLANQQIEESFSPLIGRQYAPFFASLISYGILLLPLILVFHLFNQIKALFSLQKVLLFINIYLAAYFATLWLASFIIGLEPMSFFYSNSLSSYLSLQLLQAFGYLIYLILQTANFIYSCIVDTLVGKLTGCLQWVVAVGIGLHYYVTVFHPAVTSRPPHTSWKFYAMYTVAFFILCLFARIRWVKKQYVIIGANVTDKKS
ncbi:hypothetical protein KP509_01G061500 [Ceratopteris richardii]|nr:hypothetical protein KP509_01G061500 [Ceratopteris richardii]